jgi:hypothetical protein
LYPELSAILDYGSLADFVNFICCLKPIIALQEASYRLDPPESLTVPIHEFLKVYLEMSDNATKQAWAVLRTLTWNYGTLETRRMGRK